MISTPIRMEIAEEITIQHRDLPVVGAGTGLDHATVRIPCAVKEPRVLQRQRRVRRAVVVLRIRCCGRRLGQLLVRAPRGAVPRGPRATIYAASNRDFRIVLVTERVVPRALPLLVGPAYSLVPLGFLSLTVIMLIDLLRIRGGRSYLFREEAPPA